MTMGPEPITRTFRGCWERSLNGVSLLRGAMSYEKRGMAPGNSIRCRSTSALIIWKMKAPKNSPSLSKCPKSMPPSGVRGGMTRSVVPGHLGRVNETDRLIVDGLWGRVGHLDGQFPTGTQLAAADGRQQSACRPRGE